jgi:hypothetical protein
MNRQSKGGSKLTGVLKEYLVKLGYGVDISSYDKFMDTMDKANEGIGKLGVTSASSFAKAGVAVVTFVATANAAIFTFISGLARADLETEKFARKMWMTEENARSLKNVLEVMGEEMEDIALNKELRGQFFELRNQASQLRAPDELNAQLKAVRSIMFEFKRFQLEVTYAAQWIGYYLGKYLEAPLARVKKVLVLMNDSISKSMPKWTKDIAQALSWIVRLGAAVVRVGAIVVSLLSRLPDDFKVFVAALAGLWLVMKASPLTLFAMAIVGLLLLLDDFFTYIDGGESQFEGLWKGIMDVKQALEDSGVIQEFRKNISELWDNMKELGGSIMEVLDAFSKLLGFGDFDKLMKSTYINSFQAFNVVLKGVADSLKAINDLLNGDANGFINKAAKGGDSIRKGIFKMFLGDAAGTNANDFFGRMFDWGGLYKGEGKNVNGPKPSKSPLNALNIDWSRAYGNNRGLMGFEIPPYLNPRKEEAKVITNNVEPVFNNYGSDPYLNSVNIARQMEGLLTRELQGVIR